MTTSLVPGQSATFTATYTVTQADLDNGGSTTPPPPPAPRRPGRGHLVALDGHRPATQTPSLTVAKSTTPPTTAVGQTITYSITATNAGNLTLTNLSVTDPTPPSAPVPRPPGRHPAPGASVTCSATHVITQADLDAANVATRHRHRHPAGRPAHPVTSPPLVTPSIQTPASPSSSPPPPPAPTPRSARRSPTSSS